MEEPTLWSINHLESQSCPKKFSNCENKSEFSNDENVKGCSVSDANQLQRCSFISEIYNNFDFCANENLENIYLESEHGTSQVFSKNDVTFSNMSTLNTASSVEPISRFSPLQQENAFGISSSSSPVSVPLYTTTNPSSSTSIFELNSHSRELKSITSNICEYMVYLFISNLCVQRELGSTISIAAKTSEERGATNVARTGDASVNDDTCMPESFQASEEKAYQTNMPVITNKGGGYSSNELSEDSMQGILLDEEPPNEISSENQAPDSRNNRFGTSEKSLDGKYSIAGPSSKTADVRWHVVDGRFICSRCGKSFRWKQSVVDHYRTHTGEIFEWLFSCDKCEKRFNLAKSLAVHRHTHTREKPFACDKCEKRFNRANSLALHCSTHTGEKPFACDKCEKRFNRSNNLSRHYRTHTGEKPFACDKCEKSFNRKDRLARHRQNHTKEKKPFACDKCVKTFGDASSLRSHRRTHTADKLYKCLICEKAFTRCYSRNKHARKVHNII